MPADRCPFCNRPLLGRPPLAPIHGIKSAEQLAGFVPCTLPTAHRVWSGDRRLSKVLRNRLEERGRPGWKKILAALDARYDAKHPMESPDD